MDNNRRCALMRKLQAADFAVYDARLFLNTHPSDQEAVDYYQKSLAMADALRTEYSEQYGPLTMQFPAQSCGAQWVQGPWPWEGED